MRGLRNLILGAGLGLLSVTSYAQPQVHCGEIVEDEFTRRGEKHDFLLNLEPGTQLDLMFIPVGETLKFHAELLEPTGNVTHWSNDIFHDIPVFETEFVAQARVKTDALSSRGAHTIRVYNWNAGVYSQYVSCLMRDGRELKAGSVVEQPDSAPAPGSAVFDSATSGAGTGQAAASPGLGTPLAGGNAKDLLKAALMDFAKKKAMDALAQKLAGTKAGKLLGSGSSQSGNAAPSAGSPADDQGVAQELLVAAVSPSQGQFSAPATAPPAQPVSLDLGKAVPEGLTLYPDKDFVGMGDTFIGDDANLRDNTIGNDSASSLQISAGCSAMLYADINFEGKSIVVTQSVLNLRDTRVGNDSVSSIRVRCQGRSSF